jgi:hypothetical protein
LVEACQDGLDPVRIIVIQSIGEVACSVLDAWINDLSDGFGFVFGDG